MKDGIGERSTVSLPFWVLGEGGVACSAFPEGERDPPEGLLGTRGEPCWLPPPILAPHLEFLVLPNKDTELQVSKSSRFACLPRQSMGHT